MFVVGEDGSVLGKDGRVIFFGPNRYIQNIVEGECRSSLEVSGSRSLEMSCSKDGPDQNEHAGSEADRSSQ
jgi:hypothetical protein